MLLPFPGESAREQKWAGLFFLRIEDSPQPAAESYNCAVPEEPA
jgi:hypothetical protein